MIKFKGLGHINIVVDDIDSATHFYQKIFNAIPQQDFPHFRNIGFAKAAGFLKDPELVDVTIRFLLIPGANVYLELMQYHHPCKLTPITEKQTYEFGGPRHICLNVSNIDDAFNFLKQQEGVKMINTSEQYRPFQIDPIRSEDFKFFDPNQESNSDAKKQMCEIINKISYFYFIDKYGIQWELAQGQDDMGC